jgi:S-DNA-T family DNA segregation ATPase FtsK/SpoIIIE
VAAVTGLARAAAALELFLVVRTPAGRRRAVSVRIAPDRPVTELVLRLAAQLELDAGRLVLGLPGRPGPVDGSQPVASLALRVGDEVWLTPDDRAPRPAAAGGCPWELAVVGGPLAGRRFALRTGDLTLGRGAASEVRLDDPAISRTHLRLRVDAEGVTVTPAGSGGATYLEGRPVISGRRLGPGDVLELGHCLLAVRRAAGARGGPAPPPGGRVPFNRPPSGPPAAPPLEMRLPPAPADPPRLRVPLAAVLAPLLVGLAVWLAARSAVGLLFALGTPLMAVAPALEDRVVGRWQRRRQQARFREQVAAAAATLDALRTRELRARRALAPDAVEIEERACRVLPTLWERRPGRPGFLRLRPGWGDAASAVRVEVPDAGRADLRAEAAAVAGEGSLLRALPLTLDLAECGSVGLTGPSAAVAGLARWLVVQAAVLHSPAELAVAAFLPEAAPEWEWLRRLPHVRGAGPDLEAGLLPGGPEAQRRLALALDELDPRAGPVPDAPRQAILVLAHEDAPVERAVLAALPWKAPAARVFVIWMGSEPDLLPDGCRSVIELDAGGLCLRVRDLSAGTEAAGVADQVDLACAERVASVLGGVEDAGARTARGRLPAAVGLLQTLCGAGEDADLPAAVRRWWTSAPGDLAAPVGAGPDGPVTLDLREDGPHALVGGTSGSGKSEFLRAWVTALAARHSPRRLNFLLVDFKGGTAFQDCARLPHVVGLVTDLGDHLLGRVQESLLAELKRREAEMARFGQKEFVDFERRQPDEAFPVLVVVFDEFEQLLAERPELVSDVIVPIARLGRGLGVHLVLGTQKPQGSVPEAIRSNTNIRVALRMISEAQSRDVVDAPDAAHIPPAARGRAALRLSHRALVTLQVAYAGPSRPSPAMAPGEGDAPTDFERLAAAMAAAGRELAMPAPRRPWLPPLPEVVPVTDLPSPAGSRPEGAAPIALVDEPRRQAQWSLTHDPVAHGHLLVHGAARSGKSTLLRTLACGLAAARDPSALWIYALDVASGALRSLESLPHVGGVAGADDPERVAQLLRMLGAEVTARRRLLRARGPSSWRDARLPAVLLLVDDHASFRSTFERVDGGRYLDLLEGLVRDGRAVGVHCAVATSQRRDLSGLLASAIPRRLLLGPDPQDLGAVGLPGRGRPGPAWPAGRGLLDGRLEVQVAVLADGTDAGEAAAVEALAGRLGPRPPGAAPRVEVLPEDLDRAVLPGPSGPLRPVLGLGGDAVAPVEADLLANGNLVVCGPRGSGRTTALAALVTSLRRADAPPGLVLLSGRRHSELLPCAPWTQVALGPERCREVAAALAAELPPAGEGEPTVVLVDDAELLMDSACDAALRALARLARDVPVRLVVAVEVRALRRYSEWLGEVRESRHAVLLNPDPSADAEPFGAGPLPRPLRPYAPGRGFLVRGGLALPFQVAG